MNRRTLTVLTLFALFGLTGCFKEFQEQANTQFGDQHFKTAIALIELHNIREGEYPATLEDLKYIGEWDKIIFNSVDYKRLEGGYELNFVNRMGETKEIKYPDDFWNGLGLKKSNLKN